jgi:EAL domain-containing protein (putative c-di-GMP-specific phosphodiesterase class I)
MKRVGDNCAAWTDITTSCFVLAAAATIKIDQLLFNITWDSLQESCAPARRDLRQLEVVRRLDVAIEIDDLGSGQAALSQLKYVLAIYVKIEQLFVSGLGSDRNNRIMVRSTINLVHERGRLVVA